MFTTLAGSFLGEGGAIQLYIVQSLISVCFDSFACVGVYYGVSELLNSVLFSINRKPLSPFYWHVTAFVMNYYQFYENHSMFRMITRYPMRKFRVFRNRTVLTKNTVLYRIPPQKNYDQNKIYDKG